ncbi:RadB family lipoprotein [Fusobacterium animalis]|uniref:RadB family lipoprotein n=1 Tax=Fusobacterium animalis TaxID=76859 RepID=UPI0030CCF60A
MKKGIFAMFILVASMAMVACTNANTTNEGAVGENDAFKVLEKRREYYKEQDKERAETQVQTDTVDEGATITTEDEAKAKEEADKEALKILEKKRKGN